MTLKFNYHLPWSSNCNVSIFKAAHGTPVSPRPILYILWTLHCETIFLQSWRESIFTRNTTENRRKARHTNPEQFINKLKGEGWIYRVGCSEPVYIRYVIFRNSKFQLIKTISEFQSIFAPIESTDEALSYALATNSLSAQFGLGVDPRVKYLANRIEDTHAVTTTDGFVINLYHYELCGCGPHIMSVVDVSVTKQGDINQSEPKKVFDDLTKAAVCVDWTNSE